jgi:hypothetical protein
MPATNSALRDAPCAPNPSCVGFGQQLRRWSGRASFGDSHRPDVEFDYRGPWNITGVPRTFGRIGCGRGRANVTVGAIRVTFWGALAMGVTAGVGAVFGTMV